MTLGSTIAHDKIASKLGRGGMGVLDRATGAPSFR
jgi:hypothetical protein